MNADIFRATIEYYKTLRRITSLEQLRQFTTIGSNKTMLRYWKNPELFPQGEIENIMRGLRVPREEWFKWL